MKTDNPELKEIIKSLGFRNQDITSTQEFNKFKDRYGIEPIKEIEVIVK